jgi:hypothetical protein
VTRQGAGLRLVAGAIAIVLVISVVGYFASRKMLDGPAPTFVVPPRVAAPAAVDPERQEAVILSVDGTVEKIAVDGRWNPVAVGDRLLAEDSLRTDPTGRAELAIGDKSRLTVTENTQLKVRELTRAVHQVQLTRGRLVASYDADGERVLRIEDEKGSAVAETRAAKFSILSNGQALAVATETGTVNLEAAGKAVEVKAGQQAFANVGQAPSAATPIPAEVLLKIARALRADPSLCAVIEGAVDPGSQLEIDGASVPVDAAGRFKAEISRRPGQSSARVAVRAASGRPVEKTVACRAEDRAPPVKLKMNWTTADAG